MQGSLVSAITSELSHQPKNLQLRVGLIEFPPLSTGQGSRSCKGAATETLHRIFALTRYKLTIYCSSPSRVYRDFNAGSIDLTINVKTTEALSKNALYSEHPFTTLTVSLYDKTTRTIDTNKISSVRFYSYHNMRSELEEKGYKFFDLNNTQESIAVFIRENDYKLVSYSGPFWYYLEKISQMRDFAELQTTIDEVILAQADSYFTINKSYKNAKEIKKIIDDFYKSSL